MRPWRDLSRGGRYQPGVCVDFGWVRFLVVCFLYKINLNPRKSYLLWKKVAQNATFNLFFLGLGSPWVGELFVGFKSNIYMLSNPP